MPALKDLFRERTLSSGLTAEKENAPRDSKEKPISTNSVLINNTVLPFFNKFRLRNSETNSETFLEETLTGLRPLRLVSIPFLYGTNVVRLATKSTYAKDLMNADKNSGNLGGLISNARATVAGAVNNTGLFRFNVYPSLLVKELYKGDSLKTAFDKGESMPWIYGLKKKSEGFPGLANFVQGAIKNLRIPSLTNQNIGEVITGLKTATTQIFLSNNALKFAGVRVSKNDTSYYKPTYTYNDATIWVNSPDVNDRNDLSTRLAIYNNPSAQQLAKLKELNIPQPFPVTQFTNTLAKNGKIFGINPGFQLPEAQIDKINSYLGEKKDGTDIFSKQNANSDFSLQKRYGINLVSGSDSLNNLLPMLSSEDEKLKLDDLKLDDKDFVTLKFTSYLSNPKITTRFRATITGLTETLTPQWDTAKFIGNPFPLYLYNQVERVVQFNFKVYSLNEGEHIAAWERINFLTSLCYPQGYSSGTHVTPPFVEFTLGSMYQNKAAFIETLTYTVEDSYPWETGIGRLQWNGTAKKWERPKTAKINLRKGIFEEKDGKLTPENAQANYATETNMNKWILPQIIDVNISLKIIESVESTKGRTFYSKKPYTIVGNAEELLGKGIVSPE